MVSNTTEDAMKAQEQLSLMDQSIAIETLLDETDCKILTDSSATKSFLSKEYSHREKGLYGLFKFSSRAKVTQCGHGASVIILLIVTIIVTFQDHIFEVYTMVSETHDSEDLVKSVKILVELDAELSMGI